MDVQDGRELSRFQFIHGSAVYFDTSKSGLVRYCMRMGEQWHAKTGNSANPEDVAGLAACNGTMRTQEQRCMIQMYLGAAKPWTRGLLKKQREGCIVRMIELKRCQPPKRALGWPAKSRNQNGMQ